MTARELSDDAAMQQAHAFIAYAGKADSLDCRLVEAVGLMPLDAPAIRAVIFERWADSKGLGEADRLAVSTYVSYILMRGAVHGQGVSA